MMALDRSWRWINIICLTVIFSACTHSSKIESTSKIASQLNIEKKEDAENLPFGCSGLREYDNPKNWEWEVEDDIDKDTTESIFEKEIGPIEGCFLGINKGGTIETPVIEKTRFLILSPDIPLFCQDSIATLKSFQYRLPNIGPYLSYYASFNYYNKNTAEKGESESQCLEGGNLVLIHPQTKEAFVVPIYSYIISNGNLSMHQFFLIDNDKFIHIYGLRKWEASAELKKTHVIKVASNGRIDIRKS